MIYAHIESRVQIRKQAHLSRSGRLAHVINNCEGYRTIQLYIYVTYVGVIVHSYTIGYSYTPCPRQVPR